MKWYQVSYIENKDFVTDYVLAKNKKHILSLYKDPKPYCINRVNMRSVILHGTVEKDNHVKISGCFLTYKERRERKI